MNKNMILLLSIFGLFLFLRLSQRTKDTTHTSKSGRNHSGGGGKY